MARKYDPFKGRTVKDLLEISSSRFAAMDERERRALVTRLSSVANKRVKSVEKVGKNVPSLDVVGDLGRFTAKGKSDTELTGEFLRLSRFLSDPTSTAKGAMAFVEETVSRAKDIFKSKGEYDPWTEEQNEAFWDLYGDWREVGLSKGLTKYEIADIVGDSIDMHNDIQSREEYIRDAIEREYRKREGAIRDYDRATPNRIR